MHSSLAVANKFLELADEHGRELTPMHLQKLVYIAHGWSLAVLGRGLTKEPIEVWTWGPVYRDLYSALKGYGSGAVNDLIHRNNWADVPRIKGPIIYGEFEDDEEELLREVFEVYGDLPAFQLSALTHNEGTPWTAAEKAGKKTISDKDIKAHFLELAEQD